MFIGITGEIRGNRPRPACTIPSRGVGCPALWGIRRNGPSAHIFSRARSFEEEGHVMSSRHFIALSAVGILLVALKVKAADVDPFGPGTSEKAKASQKDSPSQQVGAKTAQRGTGEQHIRRALTDLTEMEFPETPLKDVMDYLKNKHHIEIQFDMKALNDSNPKIDPSQTLITRTVKGVSLADALKMALTDYNLTYIIKDQVLLITSKDEADVTPFTRMYDVRDLVTADQDSPSTDALNELGELIEETVAPGTWACERSRWTPVVRPFNHNGICVLVAAQTFDAQQQIEEFLADLRAHKQKPAKD